MLDHMLDRAGAWMVGYRYLQSRESGALLRGSSAVGDATLVARGCPGAPCYVAPRRMSMHMHMLDLMYAPTDWLTLMLMPQLVDMEM
jgi:hypothetical protein